MKKIIIFSTVMILLIMGVMMCVGNFAHPSSIVPTVQPTEEPAPSEVPTTQPAEEPAPSEAPTTQPTEEPTSSEAPTTQPSTEKTENILPDDEL